jgi:hypothetical protein
MRSYNFTVQCASGQVKEFTCQAANFREARALLIDFAKNN